MKLRVMFLIFAIAIVFFCMYRTVRAQESTEQEFTSYNLGEVVVSGEHPGVAAISNNIEVTADDIEATNSRTVAEALAHVPGMRMSTGRKNEPGISLHGFDQTRILVLIDGVPYYETKYRKLDLNQLPTANIAKIVVTKGAASVLYGANAMGGVVNIITKKATEKLAVSATVEVGDYGYNREDFSTGWKKGIFSYWVDYTRSDLNAWRLSDDFNPVIGTITYSGRPATVHKGRMEDGGYRENSYMKSNAIWAKFGIDLNPNSEYFVNFYHIDREKGNPPNIWEERIPSPSRPVFSQIANIPRYDDWGIDLSGKQKILDQLTLQGKLYYHRHVDDYLSYLDELVISPDIYGPDYREAVSKSRYKDYFFGGYLIGEYQPVSWDVLRISYHDQADSHRQRDDAYLKYEESYSYTGSVGLENEFTFIKNLSVIAGVSRDWFEVEEAHKNVTGPGGAFVTQSHYDTGPTKKEWNPMGGLTYQLCPDTRLFASVARKSRYPTLNELYSGQGGNPDLKGEHSVNTTVGAEHSFGELAWAQLSYFYHDVYNWISRDYPSVTGVFMNFGKITMQGFELNTEFYPPIKNLTLSFDYMYNHALDQSRDRVTRKVLYMPLHKFDAGVRYTLPWTGTRLDLNATFVDQFYSQLPTATRPTNAVRKGDSQMTFDCRVSQKFLKRFEAYMAMNNLFDRDCEPEYGYPAQGRMFWFGLSAKY